MPAKDIEAQGFWVCQRESAFFDVKAFSPFAHSNSTTSQAANGRQNEREERRTYERCTIEVELFFYASVVLSSIRGWDSLAQVTFKRLASLFSANYKKLYKQIMIIRCKMAYSLIDWAMMSVRGARSSLQLTGMHPHWPYAYCQPGMDPSIPDCAKQYILNVISQPSIALSWSFCIITLLPVILSTLLFGVVPISYPHELWLPHQPRLEEYSIMEATLTSFLTVYSHTACDSWHALEVYFQIVVTLPIAKY